MLVFRIGDCHMSNCAPFPLPSLALPGLNLSFNLFSLPTISLGLACPLD